ncbi:hypothetical protein REIP_0816 [Rickettsia endosymbiont of Ixodes pacificus]|nr:hypothetical protein REIP_0816 [Rickettsia endosymbiont of Ixodes pacificus]
MVEIITNIDDTIEKIKKNDEVTEISAAVKGKIVDIKT